MPDDVDVWLVAAYALVLLGAAWTVDVLGSRSARRSMSWRHADFVYHDDVDGWRCHEDQWLWPAAFDPDKRVIRYEGAHAVCGRCPSKSTCSPAPGPREITRPVDPWPYSETGRFHRGLALVIACVGAFLSILMMVLFHSPDDLMVLGTTLAIVVAGACPLARHLWTTPDNAPDALAHLGSAEHEAADAARRAAGRAPVAIGTGQTGSAGYRSVREAAEAIARARAAASAGAGAPASSGSPAGASPDAVAPVPDEPPLRRVAALRTRKRLGPDGPGPSRDDPSGAADGLPARGGARRTRASAWRDATAPDTRTASATSTKGSR